MKNVHDVIAAVPLGVKPQHHTGVDGVATPGIIRAGVKSPTAESPNPAGKIAGARPEGRSGLATNRTSCGG